MKYFIDNSVIETRLLDLLIANKLIFSQNDCLSGTYMYVQLRKILVNEKAVNNTL